MLNWISIRTPFLLVQQILLLVSLGIISLFLVPKIPGWWKWLIDIPIGLYWFFLAIFTWILVGAMISLTDPLESEEKAKTKLGIIKS